MANLKLSNLLSLILQKYGKNRIHPKIGRLFRLALLVCLCGALIPAKAQNARVSLDLRDASLEQAMNEIKGRPGISSSIGMSRT